MSCFLHDNDLLVYTEYDPDIYLKGGKERISKDPVSQRWDKWMLEFAMPGFQRGSSPKSTGWNRRNFGFRNSDFGLPDSCDWPATPGSCFCR